MSKITDCIFLGSLSASNNLEELKEEGIKRVLSVTGGDDLKYSKTNIKFRVYQIDDYYTQNIYKIFKECIEFIDSANTKSKILVYCTQGVSRSAAIVLAYLMWKNKWTYEESFAFVSKLRFINPNAGFIQQLKLFEKNLKEKDYKLSKINFNIEWQFDKEAATKEK